MQFRRRLDTGWGQLHTAWRWDSANQGELARMCRSNAADRFLALVAIGQRFAEQPGASEAILTDTLRSAGR